MLHYEDRTCALLDRLVVNVVLALPAIRLPGIEQRRVKQLGRVVEVPELALNLDVRVWHPVLDGAEQVDVLEEVEVVAVEEGPVVDGRATRQRVTDKVGMP